MVTQATQGLGQMVTQAGFSDSQGAGRQGPDAGEVDVAGGGEDGVGGRQRADVGPAARARGSDRGGRGGGAC